MRPAPKLSAAGPRKAALFARVKDDGRAEAALIAVAGMIREPVLPHDAGVRACAGDPL